MTPETLTAPAPTPTPARAPVPVPAVGSDDAVRTYRGRTVEELIPQIRAELGDNAIILRQREGLTGGIGGFFAQRCVEIDARAGVSVNVYADDEELDLDDLDDLEGELAALTAEADPALAAPAALSAAPVPPPAGPFAAALTAAEASIPEPVVAPAAPPAAAAPAAPVVAPAAPVAPVADDVFIDFSALEAEPVVVAPEPVTIAEPVVVAPEPVVIVEPVVVPEPEIVSEPAAVSPFRVTALTSAAPEPAPVAVTIPVTIHAAPAPAPVSAAAPAPAVTEAPARADESIELPLEAGPLVRGLVEAGMSIGLAEELVTAAAAWHGTDLRESLRDELAERLPTATGLPRSGAVALVGAGGAGKSTAAAAIAASWARSGETAIAVAQLGTDASSAELSEMLGDAEVELIPAMRARASHRAVALARTEGLVVLDTPATSPGSPAALHELAATLAPYEPDAIVLAVPATLGVRAGTQLLAGFDGLPLAGLVATHADETDALGAIVELAITSGLPVLHLQAGVADGPCPADVETLIDGVLS